MTKSCDGLCGALKLNFGPHKIVGFPWHAVPLSAVWAVAGQSKWPTSVLPKVELSFFITEWLLIVWNRDMSTEFGGYWVKLSYVTRQYLLLVSVEGSTSVQFSKRPTPVLTSPGSTVAFCARVDSCGARPEVSWTVAGRPLDCSRHKVSMWTDLTAVCSASWDTDRWWWW